MTNSRLVGARVPTATHSLVYYSSERSRVAQSDLERIDEEHQRSVRELAPGSLAHRLNKIEALRTAVAKEPMCILCLRSLQSEPGIANCAICRKDVPDQFYYSVVCNLQVCASCCLKPDADTFVRSCQLTNLEGLVLLLAACNGSEEAVRFLIHDGVKNINVRNTQGETPLLLASFSDCQRPQNSGPHSY